MKGTELASEIKYYLDYSKYDKDLGRYETWKDSVKRVMDMHRNNPKLKSAFKNERFVELFELTNKLYEDQWLLGSQRALQFGGDPILSHNMKIYNCVGNYVDKVLFFQEAMYILLCGCGLGTSVQYHHINKLPPIQKRYKGTKTFVIEDNIEGWADAIGVLMSSYVEYDSTFPEYQGYDIKFDFSLIRPKGSMIKGGFKAPGSDGLRNTLLKIEDLLEKTLNDGYNGIRPIVAYDILMHIADAVLSGGVRRSATSVIFSPDDEEMMTAKIPQNYNISAGINPQRARSNNSVALLRNETSYEEFQKIFESIKTLGEPGFVFVDDRNQVLNPCYEISFYCYDENNDSGSQGCNLCEGNGSKVTSKENFLKICVGMAFMGTLQASYTDFKYVSDVTKKLFEREALLGCSFTGWMANPKIMLDPEIQREGAELIKKINQEVAKIIGINPAARTTCVKPSGNASVLLGTPSGCHGEHSEMYFRLMQLNKDNEITKYLMENQPALLEESVWSREKTDVVVYIPIEAKNGSKFKNELLGVNQLDIVKTIQQNWVEYGTNLERCVKPFLRNNVSNTVEVEDWDSVIDYIYENNKYFTAVSFLPKSGDKDYKQAPFTSVLNPQQLLDKYKSASLFASGLIVDALDAFDNDLWDACEALTNREYKLQGTRKDKLIQSDWVRRGKQFAKRFFKNNLSEAVLCLKDIHLYHKWVTINRELKPIDFKELNIKPTYTDIDTMGAMSCYGGACEVTF